MHLSLPFYQLILGLLVSHPWSFAARQFDTPHSTSDPKFELSLHDLAIDTLPKDWVREADAVSSHFVHLGHLVGSSSTLHLAFDIDLSQLNKTVKEVCSLIPTNTHPVNTSHPALVVVSVLKRECDGFVAGMRHVKDAFINRFGMDSEASRVFDREIQAYVWANQTERPGVTPNHRDRAKRQAMLLFLLGLGIISVGSYLFSSHQLAAISLSTGADKTTVK